MNPRNLVTIVAALSIGAAFLVTQTRVAEAKGLSGGDILNICLNAIYAGSTANDASAWKVTGSDLLAENHELDKVVPISASVNTKLGRGGGEDE